jgi:hypothetical protein
MNKGIWCDTEIMSGRCTCACVHVCMCVWVVGDEVSSAGTQPRISESDEDCQSPETTKFGPFGPETEGFKLSETR